MSNGITPCWRSAYQLGKGDPYGGQFCVLYTVGAGLRNGKLTLTAENWANKHDVRMYATGPIPQCPAVKYPGIMVYIPMDWGSLFGSKTPPRQSEEYQLRCTVYASVVA